MTVQVRGITVEQKNLIGNQQKTIYYKKTITTKTIERKTAKAQRYTVGGDPLAGEREIS